MHVIDAVCRQSAYDPFRDADILASLIERQSEKSWRALEERAGVNPLSPASRSELVGVYTKRIEESKGCPIT